jgi:hypothetical protein
MSSLRNADQGEPEKPVQKIRAGLDAMIEDEHNGLQGNSERDVKVRLNELAAKGLMNLDELGTKLRELEETRKTARRKLAHSTHSGRVRSEALRSITYEHYASEEQLLRKCERAG